MEKSRKLYNIYRSQVGSYIDLLILFTLTYFSKNLAKEKKKNSNSRWKNVSNILFFVRATKVRILNLNLFLIFVLRNQQNNVLTWRSK